MRSKRLVCGVGINDSDHQTSKIVSGKVVTCPFYRKWKKMIERCYSEKWQEKCPTYKGCSVCSEWLTFSNFREWMDRQNWNGNHLDKDIILSGNKIYSPDTCIFIPQAINSLLTDSGSLRGKHPIGVTYDSRDMKFRAQIRRYAKNTNLGNFNTEHEASSAYLTAKSAHVTIVAYEQEQPLQGYLLRIADEIRSNINQLGGE